MAVASCLKSVAVSRLRLGRCCTADSCRRYAQSSLEARLGKNKYETNHLLMQYEWETKLWRKRHGTSPTW